MFFLQISGKICLLIILLRNVLNSSVYGAVFVQISEHTIPYLISKPFLSISYSIANKSQSIELEYQSISQKKQQSIAQDESVKDMHEIILLFSELCYLQVPIALLSTLSEDPLVALPRALFYFLIVIFGGFFLTQFLQAISRRWLKLSDVYSKIMHFYGVTSVYFYF